MFAKERFEAAKSRLEWIKQQLLVIMSKSAASLIEVPTPEQKTQQQKSSSPGPSQATENRIITKYDGV